MNFSYGFGQIYVVPHENVQDQMQGGMCALPLPRFPTGVMRGRFHPIDGQLYCCGMFAWAGDQQQPGGMYRVRYTGKSVCLPIGLYARKNGVQIVLSAAIDRRSASDPANYKIQTWDLKRTQNYGSEHYNERRLAIQSVNVPPMANPFFWNSRTSVPPGEWKSPIRSTIKPANQFAEKSTTRSTNWPIDRLGVKS